MRALRESDPVAVGPYRLLAEIGRGGMGRVLLGAAPDGRLVAVKQVHARLAADEAFRARFRREVAASQKVSGAYTAAVMDADPEAPVPWLASVFVVGPALGDVLESAGALPEGLVRRLAAGLVTALTEIHRAGLVHRDLKPDNVLLAEDGVRVIDFGIARAAQGGDGHGDGVGVGGAAAELTLTRTGLVVGSPAFMSPEQAEGRELTPASDVFSLGSVLAAAAGGRSPFAGASTLRTLYNLVHAEPDLSAVPPGQRPVVERCLAKDPAARPSPAQLLGLVGPLAPLAPGDGSAWPPVVHRLIAARQAEVDRLLGGGPERPVAAVPEPVAVPVAGFGPAPGSVAASMAVTEPVPARGRAAHAPTAVLTQVRADPPRSPVSPRRVTALVCAGVLAVAGIGVGAYLLSRGPTDEPDKYLKMTVCPEAAPKLPLLPPEQRKQDQDRYSEDSSQARTSCAWYAGQESSAFAGVTWDLRRSGRPSGGATAIQSKDFAESASRGKREKGLGFGDAAYWDASGPERSCRLNVRDGNLAVSVDLGSKEHPVDRCEDQARQIARAALALMQQH